MNALPHATAHALPHAMFETSVHAKRSEVKSPDLTSPDLNFFGGTASVNRSVGDALTARHVLTLAGETNG